MLEGSMEWYKGLFQQILNDGLKNKTNQKDCLDLLLNMREDFTFSENKEVRDYAMKISKYAHEMAAYMAAQTGSGEFDDLYWKYLLLEAPEVLDSYCLYIEKDRKPKERFYQPRRKTLIKVVNLLQRLENDELDETFIHMPARVGKAEPLDALVLTPDGFKKMKDIHAGSKVISGTGKICNVTDVFPQGKKDVYRVTFSDGTSAECCKEHLWKVQTPDDRRTDRRKGKQAYRVIELQEMFGRLKCSDGRLRYSVDYVEPVQFEKKELLIPPYVMGALIGDGALTCGNCQITNPEEYIYEKVKKECLGYANVNLYKKDGKCPYFSLTGENIRRDLKKYGLLGKRSEEKFIPIDYLHSDVKDRIELLRGLCDTDGSVGKGEFIDYSTASVKLANDIIYIVRSLGGRATLNVSGAHYKKNGKVVECKKRYRITLTLNGKFIPVSSKKHLSKYNANKKVKKKFIKNIEYSRNTECQCIMVDDESHLYVTDDFIVTHNTQIITLGTSWHCCRNTELSNLYCSYKEDAGGAFLDGVKEIWTDPIYLHNNVFPLAKIVDTDAKANTVDLERKKKYKSLSGKGLTSGLNGLYDATGWLIADDILEGIQDVLSPDVLKRKQIIFDNNLMKRKKEKCKVIYNGTIWSLHDIYMNRMAFLENNPEAKDIRWEVLKIPALDQETDESNFDYDYNLGFSTQYYRIERAKFEEEDDMASWFSQCQQEPIERDGALFNPEHMNFYNGVLPNEQPLKIVSACDVALGGCDYLAMPVAYVYEDGSVYIHDLIFDSSEKSITLPRVVDCLMRNNVGTSFFEANAGGEGYKDEVDTELKKKGREINLVSKFAQQMVLSTGGHASKSQIRKEQRIWDSAADIRKFYFRDAGYQNAEYRKFMNNVYGFTMTGRNKHEDAPDALASLAVFLKTGTGTKTAKVVRSPY